MFHQTRHSPFAWTALELRLRGRKIDTVHLVGSFTDIYVLPTAVDAYNLNYQIVLPQNALRALTPAGQDWALGHFAHVLGAQVTD
ncbi:MAG TPA: isochorismatase, partial [Lactobacillus sp.]|nr:isochorismatase [Lactobacillus sp.]